MKDIIILVAQVCTILSFLIALISLRQSKRNKKDITDIKESININSPITNISVKGDQNTTAGMDINE